VNDPERVLGRQREPSDGVVHATVPLLPYLDAGRGRQRTPPEFVRRVACELLQPQHVISVGTPQEEETESLRQPSNCGVYRGRGRARACSPLRSPFSAPSAGADDGSGLATRGRNRRRYRPRTQGVCGFGVEGNRARDSWRGVVRGHDSAAPGCVDHRREMVVRVTEDETFDATGTVGECRTDRPRRRVIEDTGASAQPPPIQAVESRSVKGGDGMHKARIRGRW